MPINNECLIFDSPEMTTINGLPVGAMAPSPLIGMGDQIKIDLRDIVNNFHTDRDGLVRCRYSGNRADGIRTVDGNPSNFLITNLEPINSEYLRLQAEHFPRTVTTIDFPNVEFELYGRFPQVNIGAGRLNELPPIPEELMGSLDKKLLWLWNYSTKVLLVKGLTKVTLKHCGYKVSLSNSDVIEHLVQILQDPNYGIN